MQEYTAALSVFLPVVIMSEVTSESRERGLARDPSPRVPYLARIEV